MLYLTLCIIFVFSFLQCGYSYIHKIVQVNSTGEIVLVRSDGLIKPILNQGTVHFLAMGLGINYRNIPVIPDDVISQYKIEKIPVPSLRMADNLPDEKVKIVIQRLETINPPYYWVQTIHMPKIFNPSLAVYNNRTLIAYRSGRYNSVVKFAWMSPDRTYIDFKAELFGLSPWDSLSIPINRLIEDNRESTPFNALQEDPRLLSLSDGTILLTYAVFLGNERVDGMKGFKQCLNIARYNQASKKLEFQDSLLFNVSFSGKVNQKNWIPFEYKESLMFIVSIDPLHIVKCTGVSSSNSHLGTLETVYNDTSGQRKLPWKRLYGVPLRGGTPAILVRGVYLSFFHTASHFQYPHQIVTYFMGALTFCPEPPFRHQAVSSLPIAKYNFYSGQYTNKYTDFVLFPSGILMDDDGEHILVSFGHQDKDGYLIKIQLTHLLDSLEVVGKCSPDGYEEVSQKSQKKLTLKRSDGSPFVIE